MNKIEKAKERLEKSIPNWVIYVGLLLSWLIIGLKNIKSTKEGIKNLLETNYKPLIPVIQIIVYLSTLVLPILVCYLVYQMTKAKKNHIALFDYTKAEIKRLDVFKDQLIVHHQNHEAMDLYLQGMIYYCYADLLDPKHEKEEIRLCNKKAVISLISALTFIGAHKNVNNLKEVLSRLSNFVKTLSKKELEEICKSFNLDLDYILGKIEINDTTYAVTSEIKNLKHVLNTM